MLVDKLRQESAAPFLHVFTDNFSAIALYERLGFTTRSLCLTSLMAAARSS